MSDYDIPDLPSDDELGITEDDRRAFESEAEGAAPEARPKATSKSKVESAPARGTTAPVPPQGPPPLGGARGPVTLLVLLALAVLTTQWWALPAPAPANAPDTAFSSARAMTQLVDIAARPHPTGSPDHARVRAYLADALRDVGMEPTVQTTTSMIRVADVVRSATVRNLVAHLPGTDPTGTLLLTAHYDSRELAPGAGDDGMGVVTILETLRAILRGDPLRNDLLVVLTDAEELGLLGMRAWLREGRWADEVDVALSLEMRGGGGTPLMFQTGTSNGWVVRRFAEFVPNPVSHSIFEDIYRRMPNDTDFTPLRDAGVQGLNFAGIGQAHVYHQGLDRPENVSEATLQHYGEQILPLVRGLGAADLTAVDAPDVTWFTVPFVGLVIYEDAVTWGLSALLVLLLAGLVWAGRRRGALGWGGLGAGAALFLVLGAAGWAASTALLAWLGGFHPEQGALAGSAFHAEGWYLLAVAAAVFAVLTAITPVARRRLGLPGLTLGAAALPVLGAVALSVVAPRTAPSLQWPALAGLLAAAASLGVGPRRRTGMVGWVLGLILAVPVIWMMVALLELFWMGMSITLAPGLAVGMAMTLVLILPVLDVLREPNAWWAPVLGLVAAGALLGVGLLESRPAAERPAPSTLTYALDRTSAEAYWLTAPEQDPEDPGATWARAQVGATFGDSLQLPWFLRAAPFWAAAEARVVETPEPQVAVVRDTTEVDGRRVRLALRSELGAELVLVDLSAMGEATLQAVNGVAIPDSDAAGGTPMRPVRVSHWGTPQDRLLLDLSVDPELDRLELVVTEHHFRPWELLGEAPWRRPPTLAANVADQSDRAMIRTSLPLALVGASAAPTDSVPGTPTDDLPPDTLFLGDTLAPADTLRPGDTLPPADALPPDSLPGG